MGLYDYLKKEYKTDYLLTGRLNQDALEGLFSKLRFLGRNERTFGALRFKQLLRNFILGASNCLPVSAACNVHDESESKNKKRSQTELNQFSRILSIDKINQIEGNF